MLLPGFRFRKYSNLFWNNMVLSEIALKLWRWIFEKNVKNKMLLKQNCLGKKYQFLDRKCEVHLQAAIRVRNFEDLDHSNTVLHLHP